MALEGAVIRILTFGAIIELSEGVTGLLHISQISNDKIRKVEDVLNVGDVVKVRVLEVLKEERKVKLSMKGVEGNESVFTREPGQETSQAEPGADVDAGNSTFVEFEVVESEVVTTEAPVVEDVEPEFVESTVVTTEVPAVEDVEPEIGEAVTPDLESVESTAAEPVSTEEIVRHEETEGPAEA
jgi:ribosomal protein S1